MAYQKQKKTTEPENSGKAYEYAVFLLSLKLRTVGELVKKMQGRGYTESVIEKTLDTLKLQKYLNDERYAEVYLENLKMYKNIGYYGIKKKFMEKSLPTVLVDRILEEGLPVSEEIKIARRLLKKEGYAGKGEVPAEDETITYTTYTDRDSEENKEKAKLRNRLKSRGFRGDVISQVLK